MPQEKDTSSLITTGARTLKVFDDDDNFAGGVQVFGEERDVELKAIEAAMNPQSDDDERDFQALCAAMLEKGMVWCWRCETFKEAALFSQREDAPDRLNCYSYCRQCASEKIQGKRQVLRNGVRSEGYRYKERSKKRRKRK